LQVVKLDAFCPIRAIGQIQSRASMSQTNTRRTEQPRAAV